MDSSSSSQHFSRSLLAVMTKDVQEAYQEVPLRNGNSIRIIDILPARHHEPLKVKLRSIDVTDATESAELATGCFCTGRCTSYEALIYTWGAYSQDRTTIVSQTYHLRVTDNLFNTLRGLRRRSRSRTLWIDAICINRKDDVKERQQVPMMGLIYRSADQVNCVAWEPKS